MNRADYNKFHKRSKKKIMKKPPAHLVDDRLKPNPPRQLGERVNVTKKTIR